MDYLEMESIDFLIMDYEIQDMMQITVTSSEDQTEVTGGNP